MCMIKVRKVLCYFSGLVLTLAGIPFITEFIFESQGGNKYNTYQYTLLSVVF
jgi:hypothetical protein